MKIYNLNQAKGGWLVGAFEGALVHSEEAELCIKHYKKGETNPKHHHKIATEIIVVISGTCKIGSTFCMTDDVIIVSPGESLGFKALTSCTLAVLKLPAALNDKYLD